MPISYLILSLARVTAHAIKAEANAADESLNVEANKYVAVFTSLGIRYRAPCSAISPRGVLLNKKAPPLCGALLFRCYRSDYDISLDRLSSWSSSLVDHNRAEGLDIDDQVVVIVVGT